jgi:hypothetical protein
MENRDPNQKAGLLKNGNPRGNPNAAPRCGAKTRKGTACKAPAMKNGRCRLHGGKSTGPLTKQGLANSRNARLRHGLYSKEFLENKKELQALSEFLEIMAKPNIDNSMVLDGFIRQLLKHEEKDEEPDFLENIDFENLDFEDQLKIYKRASSLLNRSSKAIAKFGVKVAKKK